MRAESANNFVLITINCVIAIHECSEKGMDGGELLKYQNFKGTECEVWKENNLSVVYMKKFEHF